MPPGTKLSPQQSDLLEDLLWAWIGEIADRRRNILLVHSSLQRIIGSFLEKVGMAVEYEVPFTTAGFFSDKRVFDIVAAQPGKEEVYIIEVKGRVRNRGLGQVLGYINIAQEVGVPGQVLPGTDILNCEALTEGVTGTTAEQLLREKGVGVTMANKAAAVRIACRPSGEKK